MLVVRVNVPPIPEAIEALAEGLVQLNQFYMEHALDNGIELPSLYESGIVYRREPKGREWWEAAVDILGLVDTREGDCEDLSAYRVAELRTYDGEDARLRVVRTSRGTFHAVVERGDGQIEDPSRILVEMEQAHARARRRGR